MGSVILAAGRFPNHFKSPSQLRAVEKEWKRKRRAVAYQERYKEKAKPRNAKRRAAKLNRCVAWADKDAIAAIYRKAASLTSRTGIPHEVDHIIPLQGKLVSGLHVETNLRVVTQRENRAKWNLFEPE
ncbi:MAG: HNH endonuclease [Rudaea sp.]|uniref:HNH endonuclease signature motif containing protein n=1 Tax=unclassified Rudaea TaxID=2627037 RepID=UPI0010F6B298|nr:MULTISPECIES: HNH endonuclease signature motif containing protein [unclassified Rudaea]MBN8884175.1 HNH endonuclease [Rudaea sp.]